MLVKHPRWTLMPVAVGFAIFAHATVACAEAARTIFLDDPEARIGFGAIGKGYAANRAVFVLKEHCIKHGVVSAVSGASGSAH